MSKLFFKGRIETRHNHVLAGYNVNRDVKAGTEESQSLQWFKLKLVKRS